MFGLHDDLIHELNAEISKLRAALEAAWTSQHNEYCSAYDPSPKDGDPASDCKGVDDHIRRNYEELGLNR